MAAIQSVLPPLWDHHCAATSTWNAHGMVIFRAEQGIFQVSASIFQAVEGGHEDEAEDLYRATLPLANRVLCANVEATLSTMLTEEQCAAIIQHVYVHLVCL